jgi:hypothetical protein
MRSFEQDFRHQKSAKTPVNKGQNDFLSQKSPTSFGEEPKILALRTFSFGVLATRNRHHGVRIKFAKWLVNMVFFVTPETGY